MTETIERSVLPKHLSSSAATMFNQCPQRWKLRYVDRLADPPGIPALVGTLAHRVLELLLNEPAEQRSQARARELATNAWAEISDHNDFVGRMGG